MDSLDDMADARARLERDAMAWPPAGWERAPSAWRDDAWTGPEPFVPYDAEPQAPAAAPARQGAHYGTLAREFLETVLLTAVIFLGIRLVVQNFRIEGRSMEPNLHSGQYLLVNKLAYHGFGRPQRGDVIVFEAWDQDKDFIKRIIGIPGDEIEIRDSKVLVNGVALQEPYLDQSTSDTIPQLTLGSDDYYVMGDNRNNSSDSRAYGPLPGDRIIGKAWLTYWPPGEMGLVPESQRSSFASTP